MGCVVNGPGEMGDVDYGFVGAGPGNVNLYKGQVLLTFLLSKRLKNWKLLSAKMEIGKTGN